MRRVLLVVTKVIARVIATIELLGAMLAGYAVHLDKSVPILLALTFVTWTLFHVAPATDLVYQGTARTVVRRPPTVVLATATCVPIAFVFGMLDDALMNAQTGCVRPTLAPVLLLVLLAYHDHSCWRLSARSPRMEW